MLTIEPGVVVKAGDGQTISFGEGAPGTLNAIGTEAHPIVFTTAGALSAGKWSGVTFGAGSGGSRMEHAVVEGGGWNSTAGIRVAGSAPVLNDVTVRTTELRGIQVFAGGAPQITASLVTGTTGGDATGIYVGAGGRLQISNTQIRGSTTGAISVEAGAELIGLTGMVLTENGQDGVRHRGGTLGSSETWKSFGYPYFLIDSPVYVRGAASPVLTIEPGVVVKVRDGQTISFGEGSPGTLNAIGTEAHPIVFTTAGALSAGKWSGVAFGAGSGGSRMEHAVVEGGGWNSTAGIRVAGSAPVLNDVTVRTTELRGIQVYAGGAPQITASTVTGTTGGDATGIYVGAGGRLQISNTQIRGSTTGAISVEPGAELIGLTGMVLTENGQDGVRHRGGTFGSSETWKSFGYPYFLIDSPVYVRGAASPTLTIEPGVVVKMRDGQTISFGEGAPGTLNAIGTDAHPIVFTTAGALSAGKWSGVTFGAGSGGSRMEHAVVEGGGWNYTAGIRVAGSAPVLKNVTVRTTSLRGIQVFAGAAPQITASLVTGTTGGDATGIHLASGSAARIERTTVSGNAGAGVVNEGSRASLRFVTLAGNGVEGLRSTSGELTLRDGVVTGQSVPVRNSDAQLRVVDARQQWWGSGEGPSNLAGRVEYDPWLGALPTPPFAAASLEASTRAFPPGTSSVRFDFEFPSIAGWLLRFLSPDGSEVKRFEGTGRGTTVTWDGTGAAGVVLAAGEYRVRLEATEVSTGLAAAPLVGKLSLDGSLPVAILTQSAGFVRVKAGDELAIEGSAGGPGFQSYLLEAGQGNFPAAWTVVDRGTLPVVAGRLGSFTTALLPPGRYTLRLSVTGAAGKVAATMVRVELFEEGECR